MLGGRKVYITTTVLALGAVAAVFITLTVRRYRLMRPIQLRGAVIKQDDDPMKETPITNVEINEANGIAMEAAKSSFTGYFAIRLRRGFVQDRSVVLQFRHPEYAPLDVAAPVGDELLVVRMTPLHKEEAKVQTGGPAVNVSNVRIRYTTETTSQENIGSGVKTFEIKNEGNVSCNNGPVCSPDRKWRAAVESESLDAGEGSVFRNARVSCIAGPCPFTRIDSDGFSQGGRYIKVTVRNWSDTTTFLMQAEVFRPQIADIVRMTYPIILGTSLNFTLPPTAVGPSVEAELNGENIIFPLGPSPVLSWASCNVSVAKNETKFYRCELNAGYRFR